MVQDILKSNPKLSNSVKDYVIITFGLFLYALGWVLFLLPAEITGGGISGLGAVLYFATGIPVSLTFLSVNVVLVVIAIKILGANFGFKTIYSILVLTLFFAFFQN